MPMDLLPIWIDEIAKIKPDSTNSGSWANTLADVVDKRVTGKLNIVAIKGQVSFTFKKDVFAQLLKLALPATTPLPLQKVANAWEAAVMASTLVVAPGAYILPTPTPATGFASISASIILPPSIATGKTLLLQKLLSLPPVNVANLSMLGPALFAAFSALQASVTGIDLVTPPAGPHPLVVPTSPVI